jgi:hypothetical protein
MMDKVQKPSDFDCYTPSSEPFRFYLNPDSLTGVMCADYSDGKLCNEIVHCKSSCN